MDVGTNTTMNLAGTILGAGSLTKTGGGTLVYKLGYGSVNYTGGTFVNGGTLSLQAQAANGISYNYPLTIGSGAVASADITNSAANYTLISDLTLNGGTLTSINGVGGAANDSGLGNWRLWGNVYVCLLYTSDAADE